MRAETTERPAGSRPEAGVRPVADTIPVVESTEQAYSEYPSPFPD